MRLLLYNIRYGLGLGSALHWPLPGMGYLIGNRTNLQRITDFNDGQLRFMGLSSMLVGLILIVAILWLPDGVVPAVREALLRHRYRAVSAKNGTVEDLQERWASPVYCEPL